MTEMLVIEASRQSRWAGLDGWTACEAALVEFRSRDPEASVEYANAFISQALARLPAKTPEWPSPRSRHPAVL
ncbi:hypothetical protein KXR53_32275 [Inquilinus limosus]|uniref:hypothetical protein n=1 Tax=Inquilinus limosus TaxID=171674 RepID=UPI003F157A74